MCRLAEFLFLERKSLLGPEQLCNQDPNDGDESEDDDGIEFVEFQEMNLESMCNITQKKAMIFALTSS